jgi:hypothetical protein
LGSCNGLQIYLKNTHQFGNLISTTVGNWQGKELSEKLELEVGKDLQFIRVNGTLVGGLVGLIIYTIAHFFFKNEYPHNHEKNFHIILFTFLHLFPLSGSSIKESNRFFTNFIGEIGGFPITIHLNYTGVVDCNQYQHYVDGWYYYDKYQKKIPLTGIYDYYGNLSYTISETSKNRNLKAERTDHFPSDSRKNK